MDSHPTSGAAASENPRSKPVALRIALVASVLLMIVVAFGLSRCGGHHENTAQQSERRQESPPTSQQEAATQAAAPAAPVFGTVHVPAASDHRPSDGVAIQPGQMICRTVPDGYTVEFHNVRSANLSDSLWRPATDGTSTNGERYTSTGDAFDMGYTFVRRGESCP